MRLNKIALALGLAIFALPLTAMAQDAAAPEAAAPEAAAPEAAAPEAAAPEAAAASEAPEAAAAAEEPASNLSWNLAVVSDYVFRGITQTDFDPALQGGLDYAFGDSGWYVGTWGSNIDFADPDGPDIEIDIYAGYGASLSDEWSLDLHAIRYIYSGERDVYGSLDYNEFFAATTWNEMLTLTVAYAPDYANADISSTYVGLGGTWEVGNGFSLNAGFGHSTFSDDNGSYNDWNLGFSRSFGPVEAALTYYDTTGGFVEGIYGDDNASDTVVLSLKIGG